jgi:hypothetical protein
MKVRLDWYGLVAAGFLATGIGTLAMDADAGPGVIASTAVGQADNVKVGVADRSSTFRIPGTTRDFRLPPPSDLCVADNTTHEGRLALAIAGGRTVALLIPCGGDLSVPAGFREPGRVVHILLAADDVAPGTGPIVAEAAMAQRAPVVRSDVGAWDAEVRALGRAAGTEAYRPFARLPTDADGATAVGVRKDAVQSLIVDSVIPLDGYVLLLSERYPQYELHNLSVVDALTHRRTWLRTINVANR